MTAIAGSRVDRAAYANPSLPTRRGTSRHRAETPRPRLVPLAIALVVLAAAQSVVVLDLDLPVVRPLVALMTFVLLPTLVIHRRGTLPTENAASRLALSLGASVLLLLVGGLMVNTVVPAFGNDRPLSPAVLGVAWFFLDAALLSWRSSVPLVAPFDVGELVRRVWDTRVEPAQALGLAAVALAVVGAVRLNNGAGGQVAVLAHLVALAAFAFLLLRRGTLGRDVRALFLVSLALLLATSLRGWDVTGHDIQAEYAVYMLTQDAQHWSMSLAQNAYNACLSVTLLPTLLVEATGLSATVWFKVGLQVLFAVVPAVLFLVFRRFVSTRLALVSVALVVAFPTFHSDMPYLVRQELAFLFVALLLLAATEPRIDPLLRRGLVVALGLGVVLSHYSTTYLLTLALVGGLALVGVALLLARRSGWVPDQRPLVLLHPATVALLAFTTLMWTGPVTQTGGHPIEVARDAVVSLLGQGESQGSSDRKFFLLGGEDVSQRERLDEFVDATLDAREGYPTALAVVKDPGPASTRPEIVQPDEAPLTPVGTFVSDLGVDLGSLTTLARLLAAALVQGLIFIGAWWMFRARLRGFRGRPQPRTGDDVEESRVSTEVLCAVGGVLGALGLVVVIPSLSVEYGVLRAFLQSMLVLAPVAAVGLWVVLRRVPGLARAGGRRTVGALAVVTLLLMGLLTSALPALLGGGPAKLALANAGSYYDRYIVADSDTVTAQRLAQAPRLNPDLPKVLAPRHQTLRLIRQGVGGDQVADRTYPTLLNVESYLFTDAAMTRRKVDTIFYEGDRISYRYPLEQLGEKLDLVYSAGDSRVYR